MRSIEKKAKTVDEAIWSGLQELQLNRDQVRVEIIEPGSKGFLGLGAKAAHVRLTEVQSEEKVSFAEMIKADLNMSMKPKERAPEKKTAPVKPIPPKPEVKPAISALPQEKISPKTEKEPPIYEKIENKSLRRNKTNTRPETSSRPPMRRDHKRISRTEDESWPIPIEEAPKKAYEFADQLIQAMKLKCKVNVRTDEDGIFVNLSGDADDLGMLIGKRGSTLDAFQYLLTVVVNRGKDDHVRVTLNVGDYRKRREETLLRLAQRLAGEVEQSGKSVALEPMSPRERRLIHMALQEHAGVYTESAGEDAFRHVVIYKRV